MASRTKRGLPQGQYDSESIPDYQIPAGNRRSSSVQPMTPGSQRHYTLESRVEDLETDLHEAKNIVNALIGQNKELQRRVADQEQWSEQISHLMEDLEEVRDALRARPEVLTTLEKLSPHVDGLLELIANTDSRRSLESSDLSQGQFHTIKENLLAIFPSSVEPSKAFAAVINIENLETVCKLPEAIIVLLQHKIDAMDWKFVSDLRTDTASYLFRKYKQDHDGVPESVIKLAADVFHDLTLMLEKSSMTLQCNRKKWIGFNQKYGSFFSDLRSKLSMIEEHLLQPVAGDELAAKLTASATLQAKGISNTAVTAAVKMPKDLVEHQRDTVTKNTLQQQVQAQGYVMVQQSKYNRLAKRNPSNQVVEEDPETPTKRSRLEKKKNKKRVN